MARSLLDVPLTRDGRVRAILFIAVTAPHDWTEAEIALAPATLARLASH
jgi:GAF domain-containing protein